MGRTVNNPITQDHKQYLSFCPGIKIKKINKTAIKGIKDKNKSAYKFIGKE